MARMRATFCLLLAAVALAVAPAFAGTEPAAAATRLPELPRVPSLELGAPRVEDLAEVDRVLDGIVAADDAARRETALREILELSPRLVTAMRRRLQSIADDSNRNAMKILLYDVRRAAKDRTRDDAEGGDDKRDGPDYLAYFIAYEAKPSAAYRDLGRVLALSRMLEHAGTTEAARGMIEVYVRFGEFLRVYTQRALARLGDRSVPALIEARRHPSARIGKWAARQLDALGRAAPGQAAQIGNAEVLADVLRAYGRTRDIDAARIVISFAGSERTQLREAARQAVALYGESGHWQLRDAYENVVGKRAARDWGWERTARELFGELDKLRRAEILEVFEAGVAAKGRGELDAMVASFDRVLARAPEFERAAEMAEGYFQYAKQHAGDRRERAILALRRAERISRDPSLRARIESLALSLEAERRAERGIFDRSLLRRAIERDPDNARAREQLLSLSRTEPPSDRTTRWTIAAAIGFSALAGVLFILLRPRAGSRTTAGGQES